MQNIVMLGKGKKRRLSGTGFVDIHSPIKRVREEISGALVILGGGTPPILQAAEYNNAVAHFAAALVVSHDFPQVRPDVIHHLQNFILKINL